MEDLGNSLYSKSRQFKEQDFGENFTDDDLRLQGLFQPGAMVISGADLVGSNIWHAEEVGHERGDDQLKLDTCSGGGMGFRCPRKKAKPHCLNKDILKMGTLKEEAWFQCLNGDFF